MGQGGTTTIVRGEFELFALVKFIDEKRNGTSSSSSTTTVGTEAPEGTETTPEGTSNTSSKSNPYALPPPSSSSSSSKPPASHNPYAGVGATTATTTTAKSNNNPYAKNNNNTTTTTTTAKSNPYANSNGNGSNAGKKKPNPYAKTASSSASSSSSSASSLHNPKSLGGGRASVDDPTALWSDKYAPSSTSSILGNHSCATRLRSWLLTWESTWNDGAKSPKTSANGPFRSALLSGPPGIGKTTLAQLVAGEAGRMAVEMNASDARGKKTLEAQLGDVTGSRVLSFGNGNGSGGGSGNGNGNGNGNGGKKRVLIMDEADGMGAGDRGGIAALIALIKKSKIPIICICNDRQNPKIRSLASHCLDLKFSRPTKGTIAKRCVEIGRAEGLNVEANAAEALAESCGNDIRQCLNAMQMWRTKSARGQGGEVTMGYTEFKERKGEVGKDEMLRVSIFDAARMILGGKQGFQGKSEKERKESLFKRFEAFFVDFSIMPLLVQQNYPNVLMNQYQRATTTTAIPATTTTTSTTPPPL